MATGEIMLVDIAATPAAEGQAKLEPAKIVAGAAPSTYYGDTTSTRAPTKRSATSEEEEEDVPPAPRHETPAPVALTRYAAQMLYAPLRTVEPVAGISQVRVDRALDLSTLLPVLPVEASVLGAWRLDNSYVTAVKLRNLSAQQLTMNATELIGNFSTATFQHPYLGARGNASDTTTLYLVTQGKGLKRPCCRLRSAKLIRKQEGAVGSLKSNPLLKYLLIPVLIGALIIVFKGGERGAEGS